MKRGGGSRAIGNISLQDVQFLLTAPEIYHDYRFFIKFLIDRNWELLYSPYFFAVLYPWHANFKFSL